MRSRHGAILLEVLVSIAIFASVASFALLATRTTLSAVERGEREALAIDLARSKMGELDAGLVTLADLREAAARSPGAPETVGTVEWEWTRTPIQWSLDVESRPSDHRGLTLVSLTVTVWSGDEYAEPAADDGAAFTLRQLVRLRDAESEEYLDDELLR